MTSIIPTVIQVAATAGMVLGLLTDNLGIIVINGFFLVNATIWAVQK